MLLAIHGFTILLFLGLGWLFFLGLGLFFLVSLFYLIYMNTNNRIRR